MRNPLTDICPCGECGIAWDSWSPECREIELIHALKLAESKMREFGMLERGNYFSTLLAKVEAPSHA